MSPEEASKIIPKGDYCYIRTREIDPDGFPKIKLCEFYEHIDIDGVKVPFCNYLNLGGISNHWTEEEWIKIKKHFSGKEDDELPLDLLWDRCKYCGINEG